MRDDTRNAPPRPRNSKAKRKFAKGEKATAICDRSGFKHKLKDMVLEPGTNLLVHKSLSDGKWNRVHHPQNFAADTKENISLRVSRPDPTSHDEILVKDSSGTVITNSQGQPYYTYNNKTLLGEEYFPPPTDFSGLEAWYNAADTTTIYTSGGVYTWEDSSGNLRHLTQSISSRFPSSGTRNNKNIVTFDGSDTLSVDFGATISQSNTIIVVGQYNTTAGSMYMVDGYDSLNRQALLYTGSKFSMFSGSSFVGTATNDTEANIHMGEFNGATSKIYQNNKLITTGNAGSHDLTGLTVGSAYNPALFSQGAIYDLIVYNRILEDEERRQIHGHLSEKWNIRI